MIIKELWVEGKVNNSPCWVPVVVINLFKSATTMMAADGSMTNMEQMYALYYDPRNGEMNQELISETFLKTISKDEKGREFTTFSAPPPKEEWGKENRKHNSSGDNQA